MVMLKCCKNYICYLKKGNVFYMKIICMYKIILEKNNVIFVYKR